MNRLFLAVTQLEVAGGFIAFVLIAWAIILVWALCDVARKKKYPRYKEPVTSYPNGDFYKV